MNRHQVMFLVFIFYFIANQVFCMDAPIISYDYKRCITLNLPDGDFKIETWKIFSSESLHSDYLRRQKLCPLVKNMATLYCDVSVKEMRLFSEAKDVAPGEDFKTHFDSLSSADKYLLITVAGVYGHSPEQKKLADADLTIQLFDAYFDKPVSNKTMRPEMDRLHWLYHCKNELLKNNCSSFFPDFLPKEVGGYKSDNNGLMSLVPLRLVDKLSTYYGSFGGVFTKINDKVFFTFAHKKIDDRYGYCFTKATPEDNKEANTDNKNLLWLFDDETDTRQSVIVEHKDAMRSWNFSDGGEYLFTRSSVDALLLKITRYDDGSLSTKQFSLDCSYPIVLSSFNKQATALVVCSGDIARKVGTICVWDLSGLFPIKVWEKDIGYIIVSEFNGDGTRLLTSSVDNGNNNVQIWDTTDLSVIRLLKEMHSLDDYYGMVACASNGKDFALTSSGGNLLLVYASEEDCFFYEHKLADFSAVERPLPIKIVYSPDGNLLAAIISELDKQSKAIVFSTKTQEELISIPAYGLAINGIGFTADSNQLVFVGRDNFWYKRQLLHESDEQKLECLMTDTSLHQLLVLRRLYWAYQNKGQVKLYEEEPAYKALQALSIKSQDVGELVKKYLPYIVVTNNKKNGEVFKDACVMVKKWWESFLA